ncbi:MAG: regulatory protein GemA [Gammaproteobacteria bacterium]|nr:regulatory protein GemA [Gammaproteobacteria bacterium]
MKPAHDNRRNDLAKIHIAKKDLSLDDETYRTIVRSVGGAESGSSADLSPLGRARVLAHFRRVGWNGRHQDKQTKKRITAAGDILASDPQVRMIRSLWIQMADGGAVKNRDEQGLRAWVRSATRRYHNAGVGYSAPEFLPGNVAQKVIEHLKSWARRCKIELIE